MMWQQLTFLRLVGRYVAVEIDAAERAQAELRGRHVLRDHADMRLSTYVLGPRAENYINRASSEKERRMRQERVLRSKRRRGDHFPGRRAGEEKAPTRLHFSVGQVGGCNAGVGVTTSGMHGARA